MATITFDTHAFVKHLTSVGVPEPQAEALAEEQTKLIGDQLATKRDLAGLKARLTYALTVRLGGVLAASVAVAAALVKLL